MPAARYWRDTGCLWPFSFPSQVEKSMSLTYSVRYPLAGNLHPSSFRTRLPAAQITTFASLSKFASEVSALYSTLNIAINPSSELAKILKHAHIVSKEWEAGQGQSMRSMVDATNAMRVIGAILEAGAQPAALEILRRIARNDVDLASRKVSQGKDALWEIELLLYLSRKNVAVKIGEPDLVVDLNGLSFPIACKRIHSEKGVEGHMSKGVAQLAALGGTGFVALNIDHLLPQDTVLDASTLSIANHIMHEFVRKFLTAHERQIRRFMEAGRCDGVLVSATSPADIGNIKPRINNCTATLIWCPPSWLTPAGKERVAAFRRAYGGVVISD